jgi:hypothetical protein
MIAHRPPLRGCTRQIAIDLNVESSLRRGFFDPILDVSTRTLMRAIWSLINSTCCSRQRLA